MTSRAYFFTFFVLFAIFFVPISPAGESCPPLNVCTDPRLQARLDRSLGTLDLSDAAESKDLCVALVDITDPHAPRMASVNGDTMVYAASLPKIAILLGAFDRISRGDLPLDGETRNTMTRMIRNSCNRSATEMLNRVGKEYLADLLQSPRYRFYDPKGCGGLWVGKEYGKSPAFRRDPLFNLSHGATALQTARFYYMLETGRLVSPRFSREMKRILSKPAIHHKFVKGLEAARPGSKIYRKSGTWKSYHADSAIVERDGRKYIAVALAHGPGAGAWFPKLIVALDDLIFRPTLHARRAPSPDGATP